MHFFSKKIFFSTPGLADFVCLLGLFVWIFLSISRIFHSFGDVIITGEGLQILTYTRHSLSSEGSSACLTYCQRGNPFQFHDLQGRVVMLRCGHIHDMVKMCNFNKIFYCTPGIGHTNLIIVIKEFDDTESLWSRKKDWGSNRKRYTDLNLYVRLINLM